MVSAVNPVAVVGLPGDQGWRQAGELGLALALSACVGVEREVRQKNAGLRTHSLVGLGAALFMLTSKYGFNDVIRPGLITADPSRMAAQIVSGVGFLGAGLIFVRHDAVRGLTTAAAVWVTAAIGAAAVGLPVLAIEGTAAYLIVATAFPALARRLPRAPTATSDLRIRYPDEDGTLRQLLQTTTAQGFTIGELSARSLTGRPVTGTGGHDGRPMVEVTLNVHGRRSVTQLAAALSEIDNIEAVLIGPPAQSAAAGTSPPEGMTWRESASVKSRPGRHRPAAATRPAP
jgi:putative Mg2+ transporter-C (MgtC) family protein